MNDETRAALDHIQSVDPDGGERAPTPADHEAHEVWARLNYGDDIWALYLRGGWAQHSDV